MPEVKIAAEARTEFGKGAARRIRREGKVPAVLYGHGTETRHLTLPFMSPYILYSLILQLIGIFQYFTQPQVMTGPTGLERGVVETVDHIWRFQATPAPSPPPTG